jgi:hypothetical protein
MTQSRESVSSKILVGVIIALVAGGSSPWWLKFVIPEAAVSTTTPAPATAKPNTSSNSSAVAPGLSIDVGPSTVQVLTGCVLTISNPFATLHEKPAVTSVETGSVPAGQYETSDTAIVQFAGQDQRWFQITAAGRTGWIQYDTILVAGKSPECP